MLRRCCEMHHVNFLGGKITGWRWNLLLDFCSLPLLHGRWEICRLNCCKGKCLASLKLSSTHEVLTVGWGKRHPGNQSEGKVTMQCRRSPLQRALRKSGADYLMARQTSFWISGQILSFGAINNCQRSNPDRRMMSRFLSVCGLKKNLNTTYRNIRGISENANSTGDKIIPMKKEHASYPFFFHASYSYE